MTSRIITESEALAILTNEEAENLPFERVNEAGLKEIHAFLAERHKLGGDHFDRNMLLAWAEDAEYQLGMGNPATIELKSWDSISGHTECFTVSEDGISWEIDE